MLDESKRKEVMRMFGEGKGASEIAKKVGVSRPSVYRIIESDLEEDSEIHALKKEIKKAELEGKLEELKKPMKMDDELAVLKKEMEDGLAALGKRLKDEVGYIDYAIDGMFSWVLGLRYQHEELKGRAAWCVYCDADLEFHRGSKDGRTAPRYRCNRCNKTFFLP